MLFSLRRKAPKDSPRRCLGLLSICWEVHTHGSQQTEPRTYVRSPSFAVREVCATEKPAPAGARLPERTRCPFGVFRRGLHELTSANTCWEPTECALGSHKRSSGTLAVSFRPFLVRTRKGHVSSLPKEKICAFLTEEKSTKRLTETPVSGSHSSAGKHIPTARRCCSARKARTGHHSPCGGSVRLEAPRPQAQGARRMSAFRHDTHENGGG